MDVPNNALIQPSTCMICDRDQQSTDHWQCQPAIRQCEIKTNVRVPRALLEHSVRRYHPSIEVEHRLSKFQLMPLDDTHYLWDTIGTTPAILGDRRHFLEPRGCGDGVVNDSLLVRDIRVHVIGRAEYEAHGSDLETSLGA